MVTVGSSSVFPLQMLVRLQSTCAQISLFLLHSLFLPLQDSTSPPTALYPSGTSWDRPCSARTQQALPSLVGLQGVQFLVSLLQVSAHPSTTRGPSSMSLTVGYRAFPPELRKMILPFVGLGVEQELLGKGLRAWRSPAALM